MEDLPDKIVFIRDFWRFGSIVKNEMVPAAILDLALWRKMPAFLWGTGALNLF